MHKKMLILFLFYLATTVVLAAPQSPKKIKLHVEFRWQHQPEHPSDSHPFNEVNVSNTVVLNPSESDYRIVFTEEKIINEKFPVTLALLVKVMHADAEKVDLQFQVLEYGFAQKETLWMQPRLIFRNGETAGISTASSSNPHLSLKVSAKWLHSDCQPEDVHCTHFVGDATKKNGRYVKATLLSEHPISHIHCIRGKSSNIIPQPAGKGWGEGRREFKYEQCFDASCKDSRYLGKEVFSIIKNGEIYTSTPHAFEISLLNDYGQPCSVS